jgi:hypothetical protein
MSKTPRPLTAFQQHKDLETHSPRILPRKMKLVSSFDDPASQSQTALNFDKNPVSLTINHNGVLGQTRTDLNVSLTSLNRSQRSARSREKKLFLRTALSSE